MANYQGVARTNYVHVSDIEGLRESLERWEVSMHFDTEGRVCLIADTDGAGWPWLTVDEGDDLEMDPAVHIMPFVKEEEVLILMEAGHENARYVNGYAQAYMRKGEKVRFCGIGLNDIYSRAAKDFGVDQRRITPCEY